MKKTLLGLFLVLVTVFSLCATAYAYVPEEDPVVSPNLTYTDGTWNIYHYSSVSYGEVTNNTCTSTIFATSAENTLYSKCTSYSSNNDSDGNVAYAKVKLSYLLEDGTRKYVSTKYHKVAGTISASVSVPKGCTARGIYTAAGSTDVMYYIKGTIYF